jgi:O-methyltransferase
MSFLRPVAIAKMVKSIPSFKYYEDGMATAHVADFLTDPKFTRSYEQGVKTGSWHGSDIRWRVYNACWAASQVLSLPGDFVECGVNRGGISRAVMEYIDFASQDRQFFLLDTFKGSVDVAEPNQNDYRECYDDVVKTFAPFPNAKVIRGLVPSTLGCVDSEKICYLSIDMNNPEPEISALRFFWPRLVSGAVVLLDDYAYSESYRSSKNSMDILGVELGFHVLTMPTGQGLIIKTF